MKGETLLSIASVLAGNVVVYEKSGESVHVETQ